MKMIWGPRDLYGPTIQTFEQNLLKRVFWSWKGPMFFDRGKHTAAPYQTPSLYVLKTWKTEQLWVNVHGFSTCWWLWRLWRSKERSSRSINKGLNSKTERLERLDWRWQKSLDLRWSNIMGSNHNTLHLLPISTLWTMVVPVVAKCLVGSLRALFWSWGYSDIMALDVIHNSWAMVPEEVDWWWHLVPAVRAGMKFAPPSLTKGFQPVNMDEFSTVEGLEKCFETNNNKRWSMNNLCQK